MDSGSVDLKESGTADIMFHLPALKAVPQTGYLELEHDAVPADDRYYFMLRPAGSVPVLVVGGVTSALSFDGSGDFVAAALQPPAAEAGARSPFAVKSIAARDLAGAALADYAAVCLADVPRLDAEVVQALRQYVAAGGLLVVFPGPTPTSPPGTRRNWCRRSSSRSSGRGRQAAQGGRRRAQRSAHGHAADRRAGPRAHHAVPQDGARPGGRSPRHDPGRAPLLVRSQAGKGKIYVFAVSAQTDFSNLPFTPVLLLTVHRMLLGHLGEVRDPPSLPTLTTLEFPVSEGRGAS